MGKITIRFWEGSKKKESHISLQVGDFQGDNDFSGVGDNGIYVSIYPAGRGVALLDREGIPFKTKTLIADMQKYEKEKIVPKLIVLFSLNDQAIIAEYKKFVDRGFNFSFISSTLVRKPETYDCACIVLHLIEKGLVSPKKRYGWKVILVISLLSAIKTHFILQAINTLYANSLLRYKILHADKQEYLGYWVADYFSTSFVVVADNLLGGLFSACLMVIYAWLSFSTSSVLFNIYINILKYDILKAGVMGCLLETAKSYILNYLNVYSNSFFLDTLNLITFFFHLMLENSIDYNFLSNLLDILVLNFRFVLIFAILLQYVKMSISDMIITPNNVFDFCKNLITSEQDEIKENDLRNFSMFTNCKNNFTFKNKGKLTIAASLVGYGIFRYFSNDEYSVISDELFTNRLPTKLAWQN